RLAPGEKGLGNENPDGRSPARASFLRFPPASPSLGDRPGAGPARHAQVRHQALPPPRPEMAQKTGHCRPEDAAGRLRRRAGNIEQRPPSRLIWAKTTSLNALCAALRPADED